MSCRLFLIKCNQFWLSKNYGPANDFTKENGPD